VAPQQRIPLGNQHRIIAMLSIAVQGMMRRNREKRSGTGLCELCFEPCLLLIVLLPAKHKAPWPKIIPLWVPIHSLKLAGSIIGVTVDWLAPLQNPGLPTKQWQHDVR